MAAHGARTAAGEARYWISVQRFAQWLSQSFDFIPQGFGVYTAKILKGTPPADLPIEQATKFEMVIDLKTANSFEARNSSDGARARRRGD
jgi:hypothetical protein